MSNDWISLTDGSIYNPTSIQLTSHEEVVRMKSDKSPGMFWRMFELTSEFKFRRRRSGRKEP